MIKKYRRRLERMNDFEEEYLKVEFIKLKTGIKNQSEYIIMKSNILLPTLILTVISLTVMLHWDL